MRVVWLIIVLVVWLILQNMWLESMVEPPVDVKIEQVPVMHTLPLR